MDVLTRMAVIEVVYYLLIYDSNYVLCTLLFQIRVLCVPCNGIVTTAYFGQNYLVPMTERVAFFLQFQNKI